jgi:hypothetical protein
MRKRVWINVGDIVLVGLRDFQDEKADVILKYMADEARNLKTDGELPEHWCVTFPYIPHPDIYHHSGIHHHPGTHRPIRLFCFFSRRVNDADALMQMDEGDGGGGDDFVEFGNAPVGDVAALESDSEEESDSDLDIDDI